MSQKVMDGSCVLGSASVLTRAMPAPSSAPSAMPASTRTSTGSWRRTLALMATTTATAASPPPKARACTAAMVQPRKMPSTAPRPAPAETPRMSGETSGLRNMPW